MIEPGNAQARQEHIVIDQLTHRYPNADTPALNDISLTIARGSTFGLLGPNGAGKSTLLSILTGIIPPQSGRVIIGGHALPEAAEIVKANGALVPQEYAFYPSLTGLENLKFFAGLYRLNAEQWRERLAHCLHVCRLSDVIGQRSDHYSGGLKRRLNLAIGLLARPQILFLDEPTVGIDAVSRGYILEAIAQLKNTGVTIVYTSHYMEEVEQLCDDLAVIDHGRVIVRDRVSNLLSQDATKYLNIIASKPISEAARLALAPWNAVFDTECKATLTAEKQQLPEILQTLTRHDVPIEQLQFGVSRLHDVYLRLLEDR
ncbi:MAG TPA: ABC transporter ATP-binding protein [Steroidobacteraceae bacterium]|nr:ABC transporter ATP-binding protein [Steroidobacteraceae bacterium]